jgi:hypothetical protein
LFPVPVPVAAVPGAAVPGVAVLDVAAPGVPVPGVAVPGVAVPDSMICSTRSAEPTTPMVSSSAAWRCPWAMRQS